MARTPYRGEWPQLARLQIAAQPWCSWCKRTDDLTADHVIPGRIEAGLQTLCRSCNSRRRHGYTTPRPR